MSLYRRGRVWWIKLSSHQGPVRESTGTSDKKAAWEVHEKRKGEIWRQDRLGEAPPVEWGKAVKTWLELKPRGLPDRYRIAALDVPPDSLLPMSSRQASELLPESSSGSFNRTLALIVAIHNAAGVEPPSVERRQEPKGRLRWLTAEEWKKLRKAVYAHSELLGQLADFSIATGVRENNALNLEWSQVDLRRRAAWFYADQMKGRVEHGIPLTDGAMDVLEARRGAHKVYVFPNPETGLPYVKASNRAWYASLRTSKLKETGVVWHTLRHTWASWFVMNGGTLQELMQLGGWKSYSMVLRYAHLATGHLAEAAERSKPVSLRYNARKRTRSRHKLGHKGG